MIDYQRHVLDNGLTIILHQDNSTPLVAVNILYKVGAKNEHEDKTGFAHLFEHLMFSGSENVPDFDTIVQNAGGENNAFTNSDLTNYYDVMPSENLETALWIESDRMRNLNINQNSLDVQKKVVIEEFKETSLNKPYGDLWHHLSGLAYKKHPYKWPTIGLIPEHIEQAELHDVQSFFDQHYAPNNAVIVLAGKFEYDEALRLIEKWFSDLKPSTQSKHVINKEPIQKTFRQKTVKGVVPTTALYIAFHMPERLHPDFSTYDIISDIFSGGRSSRFHQNLLKKTELFSNVDAYITGSIDPGLFIIEAKLMGTQDIEQAGYLIWHELQRIKEELVDIEELQKIKNSLISSVCFSEVSITHKAINLAYYEMLGDVSLINEQEKDFMKVTPQDILRVANIAFTKENCSEIHYYKG
jgi:zinc protease